MNPEGFSATDFAIFDIPGFAERMAAVRSRLRPKLEILGAQLARQLTEESGLAFHSHVATHARRRVNPPDDTWVALGRSRRGYKRYAHLSLGIEGKGLYTRFILKAEAEDKPAMEQALREHGLGMFQNLARVLPDAYWFTADHPDRIRSVATATMEELSGAAQGLLHKRTAAFAIGEDLLRPDPRCASPTALLDWSTAVCRHLLPWYEAALAQPV